MITAFFFYNVTIIPRASFITVINFTLQLLSMKVSFKFSIKSLDKIFNRYSEY